MLRTSALVSLGVLGLLAAAAVFLLTTTTGLRLVVDQALSRSGAPVEISAVQGRLLGTVMLSGVSYRDPATGTGVRIDAVDLDWRPAALLSRRLRLAHLHASGVEYTPGTPPGDPAPREASADTTIPDIPVPIAVRIDDFRLDRFAVADGSGSFNTFVERAAFRASLDADGVVLTDVAIDAGRYSIHDGRIRVGLDSGLPLEATLGWRAAAPDMAVIRGSLTVAGSIVETLTPVLNVEAPFAARAQGTISGLLNNPGWSVQASIPEPVALDGVVPSLPAVSVRGGVHAEGDAALTQVTPDLSLGYQETQMRLTGEIDVSPDAVVARQTRLAGSDGRGAVNMSGRIAFGGDRPFELRADWQSLRGPESAPWTSRSGEITATGDMNEADVTVAGTITPPGQDEETPVRLEATARRLDTRPAITGRLHMPRFTYTGVDARDITATFDIRSGEGTSSDIVVKAAALGVAGREAVNVELRASGAPARHEASLAGELDGWTLETALNGSYEDGGWAAELTRLAAASPGDSGLGEWVLAAPAGLTWSPSRSEVEEICLDNADTRLCANGFFAGPADWRAAAAITDLPLRQLAANTPEALQIDGTLDVRMDIGDRGDGMSGEARADVNRATVSWQTDNPVTTEYRELVATASLTPDTLRASLEGRVDESGSIRGELVTRDPLAADGDIRGSISAELPSLRVIQAAVPDLGLRQGTAKLALSVDGTRSAPRLSGDGRIADAVLDIAPLGIQLSGLRLDVSSDDGRRVSIDARADSGEGSVSANGHVNWPEDGAPLSFALRGDWESLRGPDDAAWTSRSGELEAEGSTRALTASMSGSIAAPGQDEESDISLDVTARNLDAEPEIKGSARLPYIAYGDTVGRDIAVDIDFRSAGESVSNIFVRASRLRVAGRDAAGIELRVTGEPARHEAALTGEIDGWAIETRLTGSYREERWTGRFERLSAARPADSGTGQWVLAAPADFAWSPSRSEVEEICLDNADTRLCANGFFAGPADWRVAAELTGLPLRQLAREAPDVLRLEGHLAASAELGDRGEGMTGEARARIDHATIAWEAEDPVATEYRELVATASLTPDTLRASLEGRVDESGSIRGELVTRDPLAADGDIRGSISAELPSLRVTPAAGRALGLRQGTAKLALSVDGTRSAPRLSGDGRIADAVLDVAPLGIQLSGLHLDVSGDDSRRLDISARADSGEGPLSADGHIEWPEGGGWQADVRVSGDQAQLVRTPKALVYGSPDLRIAADESGGTVNGSIPITRAELTPEAGRPGVAISDDIVIKGADAGNGAARNPMVWHAKVTIELGDNTRFRGYGLKARLAGAFEIDAPPRQPSRANGSIQIHDGEYSIYGRSFEIRRGRLVYTGGPIDNPGVDVEVAKDVRDVSVSMSITGPLVDPELRLTSTPAMSETDQMSYLLLGRPASQASEAEAGLLLQAAASLLPGGGGAGVPRYIQSTLGLDTLEVRTDSAETEGAAVEVGKYLAPDLYVSYIAGFQQGVDIFRVRYELARHWLLQAESTTRGSGGDVLFTW